MPFYKDKPEMNLVVSKFNWTFCAIHPRDPAASTQETVVRFDAAGTKTVSNILLFLSRSSFSSPPPASTFLSEDIEAHLKNGPIKKKKLLRVFFRPVEKR